MSQTDEQSLGTTQRVQISELHHYPGNARVHDLGAIAESLDVHGLYRPVVVQKSTMRILAGNGTVEAARDVLGWETIDAYIIDVDDDRALRINIVDNQTQALGSNDVEALLKQLRTLDDDLIGTGFQPSDLDALQAELDALSDVPDFEPDDAGGDTRLDRRSVTDCPKCGHTFTPKTRSEVDE